MISYEDRVRRELREWKSTLFTPPGMLERASKKLQTKINDMIPAKVHQAITAAVRGIVQSVLTGIDFIPKGEPLLGLNLWERDRRAEELLDRYKRIAAVEGAGTGAGGIALGLVDFPALIAIKMKYLFELAHIYGYSTRSVRERIYILHIFQLAFSSLEHKRNIYRKISDWEQAASRFPCDDIRSAIDWEQFQREYRDSIDFKKMLQLVPGIGAIVGAWANYGLLDELGAAGKNCYRMRILEQ